eukprot:TRINITY_DN12957_c0_g1_i1.p1 TRINITY_DN12957_c0_g1~~TRINITY_DN12957_c0_g1_i1.p1  ORF type:complete len:893 (-),score=191.05 TRINITY_DN12957_c0_g1_i1:122-2461(-)
MANRGRTEQGLAMLKCMEENSVNPDLPSRLIALRLHGASGNHEAALAILRQAAKTTPSGEAPVELYNACITALGQTKAIKKPNGSSQLEGSTGAIKELLKEMREKDIKPTCVTFGAALQAMSRRGAWQQTLGLLSEMQTLQLRPDAQAFTASIGASGRAGKGRTVLCLLGEAEAEGVADLKCRNAAIAACGRAALWQEALCQLSKLGSQSTTVSWNAGITACAEASEWSQALKLLCSLGPTLNICDQEVYQSTKSLAEQNLTPDRVSFNATLAACRNAGRWREVLLVLESMRLEGVVPDDSTLSTVASACERGGVPELGFQLWHELWKAGARPTGAPAYNAVLRSAASSSLWRQVLAMIREMAEKDVPRGRLACRAVLRACDLAGQTREAAACLPFFQGQLPQAELERLAAGLETRLLLETTSSAAATPAEQLASSDKPRFKWLQHGPAAPLPQEFLCLRVKEPLDLEPLRSRVVTALPGSELWPLGSNAEGLRSTSSDVDCTVVLSDGLEFGKLPFEQARDQSRQVLRTLRAKCAKADSFSVTELILEAKRPILRLVLACGTPVDVSVEHRAGCRKSALVASHFEVGHPALREACFLLKTWAQRRGVYGQQDGFPSGLGFVCLGIFASQCGLEPPVATSKLQLSDVPEFVGKQMMCRESIWQEEPWEDLVEANLILPKLLHGIFSFYTEDFSWEDEVVSIRSAVQSFKRRENLDSVLSIEDPIEPEFDLARPYMDKIRTEQLRQEMRRAKDLLALKRWDEAFHPIEQDLNSESHQGKR